MAKSPASGRAPARPSSRYPAKSTRPAAKKSATARSGSSAPSAPAKAAKVAKPPQHGHVVAIRRNGETVAYQLRLDGGGPGRSQFFSASRHGGIKKAQRAAMQALADFGLTPRGRGGSPVGRLTHRSRTAAAGIRFARSEGRSGDLWRVVATWVDADGANRHTSFSVARHGVKGALELAIEARASAGAPRPPLAPLLRKLREAMRESEG